jgi:hypothetical protein
MSRINTENLLKIGPIQPDSNTNITQPNYKTSQFSGGQVQLGQVAQQVGPTGDAAMFQALADIASGGAKAINIFADVSSSIDKAKIKDAEVYFGELNTRSDLTPDKKQEEFDKYIKDIWTPVLGDTWRRQMALEVDKNWTSTEARNKYESSRYETEYNSWKRQPENSGRTETNELIQEFNTQYETKFPSAKYNDWFTEVTTKVNSAIAIKNAEQAVIDFRGSIEVGYQIPSKEALNAYYNSANMEENLKFEQMYARFFELKASIDNTSDFATMNGYVYNHLAEALQPEIQKLPPDAAQMVAYELDQIAQSKTKEIFSLIQSENISRIKTQSALNLGSNENDYQLTRNTNAFLETFTQNVGNLTQLERRSQVDNLIPFIWKTLSTGNSQEAIDFRALPLDKQVEQVSTTFKTWYESTKSNFKTITGIMPDQLDNFIAKGSFAVVSDEKLGGTSVSLSLNSLGESASQTKNLFTLQSEEQVQKTIEAYRNNAAQTLGISVESLQQLSYITNQQGGVALSTESLTETWFKGLPDKEKTTLIQRGYTANSFAKLDNFRTKYVDLETSALTALTRQTTGTGTGTTNPTLKLSDSEIKAKLIMDPSFMGTALASRSILLDPKQRASLDQETQASLAKVDNILGDMEIRFNAFISERGRIEREAGSTNPRIPTSLRLFTDKDNTLIPVAVSPQEMLKKLEVDSTGSLTPKGIEAVLRLEFIAMEMAKLEPTNTEATNFKTQTLTLLREVASSGFAKVLTEDPQRIYALTHTFAGLSQGDPTFISAQAFTGQDSDQLKSMVALLKTAHSLSGGLLDTTPGDSGDPNIRFGYKQTSTGALRLLSEEEKNRYNNHPMKRTMDSWRVAMDVFASPIATRGEGSMNPLISGSFNKPQSIKDEVSNVFAAFTMAGPNSYRDEGALVELIRRFNFPGATTDTEKVSAFGNAMWNITGNVYPRVGEDSSILVQVPSDNGFIKKRWNSLSPEEQIGVYLADLHKVDGPSTEMLFTGWLRSSSNPGVKDVYNLDMFVGTAGYLMEDLIKPRVNPVGGVTPRRYLNRTFENTAQDTSQQTNIVYDGRIVSRRDLFNQAQGIGLYQYKVNTESVTTDWVSPGVFETKPIQTGTDNNGNPIITNQTVRIGEVTSEDQFVITTQLSAAMDPDEQGYAYYEWWAKLIGQTPVDAANYRMAVSKLTIDPSKFRTPATTIGSSGMPMYGADQGYLMRPPLFSVIGALHKVDLTDNNVEISVDHKGDMRYHIGAKSYLVNSNPPLSPKTQFSNANDAKNNKETFELNRKKLETERAKKRVAYKLGNDAPVYVVTSGPNANQPDKAVKLKIDQWMSDYWQEVAKSENPYQFMVEMPFTKYMESKGPKSPQIIEDIKSFGTAVKSFINNGFRYAPEETWETQVNKLMKDAKKYYYRQENQKKRIKEAEERAKKPPARPLFNSPREFMEWLIGYTEVEEQTTRGVNQ